MNLKKSFLSLLLLLSVVTGAKAIGWPSGYEGVMLQGFYWDSYSDSKWSTLESQADELSQYFSLIWVPNSGKSASSPSMGYDPVYWFTTHKSSFGTEDELASMIATFKAKGTGIISDCVINHRSGVSNWYNFPAETWNGTTYQIGLEGICKDDELASAGQGVTPTGAYDTGEGYASSRDLDHTNANVQLNCKNYVKCLLDKYGFAGVRYDMSKGYGGQYTKIYNTYANVEFSVGEYWDGSYDAVAAWIEATGKTSAAFDFPCKYAINNAFANNDMTYLVWKANGTTNQPAGLIHYGYPQYSVTFIDNHDTYRDSNAFSGNIEAANAFIICSPGTPCVFLPHWQAYKSAIKKMIAVRNAVGVNNTSVVTVLQTSTDCYMAEVTGSKGKLVVKIGSAMTSPSGYSDSDIQCYGTDWCIWSKTSVDMGGTDDDSSSTSSSMWILGNLGDYGWGDTPGTGVAMTKDGSTYTAKNVTFVLPSTTATTCYFNLTDYVGADWDVLNAGANRYGAATEGEAITVGKAAKVTKYAKNVSASGCLSWTVAPGTYDVVFDSSAMTLTLTEAGSTGDTGSGDTGSGDDTTGGDTGSGDYTGVYVNVIGDFNEWKDNGLTPDSDGITKHEGLAIGTSEFKVKTWDGTEDAYWSTGSALTTGKWITIDGDVTANMSISGATASSVYDVEFNYATHSIRVTLSSGSTGGGDSTGGDTGSGDSSDFTIYYDNSATGWSNVNIHYWSSPSTTWPGVAMTKVDTNIWSYTFPSDPTGLSGFLFCDGVSNSGKQSADYSGAPTNGHLYKCSSSSKGAVTDQGAYSGSTGGGDSTGGSTGDEYSQLKAINGVYLKNTAGWSTPTVWAWSSSENCTSKGSWPGDAMTKDGDYWVWTIPSGKGTPTGIIFSNSGSSQTSDLTYVNSGVYDNSGSLLGTASGSGSTGGGDSTVTPSGSMWILGNLGDYGWGDTPGTGVAMTQSGSTYTATGVTFVLPSATATTCYFNLTDYVGADWDDLNAGANRYGAATEGEAITVGKASKVVLYANNVSASGCLSWTVAAGTYDVVFDSSAMTITLTAAGSTGDTGSGDDTTGGDTGSGDYTGVYVNVIGDFNEWKDNGLTPGSDGITKHEGLAIGTSEFKVKTWDGTEDTYWSTGGSLTTGQWITIDGNADENMSIAGATASSVYDVEFNYTTHAIRVTLSGSTPDPDPTPDPTPDTVGDMWILGNLGDYGWGDTPGTGVAMTKDGSTYTAKNVTFVLPSSASTTCYFNLTDYVGADWDELNAGANRYGAATEGEAITVGKASKVVLYANNVSASGCLSWTVAPGTYDVVFDSSAMTITLTATSGVEAIELDNQAEAVYYNLQGVRVNRPTNGLYIVVRGNQISKEIVK